MTGDIWLKYPATVGPTPTFLGMVFKAVAEFRTIMNEIVRCSHHGPSSPVFLQRNGVKEILGKLRGWYDGLPDPLLSKNIALPVHFHLQYVSIM